MPIDPVSSFRLDGKVAIVTGASSGLGARFARVLDNAGARVVITARREDRLNALAGELNNGFGVSADLSDAAGPARVVNAALDQFGQVDVVVNNAGASHKLPAVEETTDEFEAVLRVNLTAPFVLAQLAAAAMIDRGTSGSIVNVASIWGTVGVGQIPDAAYAASKGGLVNLTRELAAQWARQGVRVNALAPGWFPSEMTAEMMDDERSQSWIRSRAPMGRPGEPHELDGALLFLASDASSYVTGQVLCVDGGWTAV